MSTNTALDPDKIATERTAYWRKAFTMTSP